MRKLAHLAMCNAMLLKDNRGICSTVKKGQLERHKDICPKFVELQSLGKNAWHLPLCNAGEGPDVELPGGVQHSTSTALDGEGLAQRRAAYAQQMGPQALNSLIQKVHTAYEQVNT